MLKKLGWVSMSLERNQDAINAFFQVVSGTRNDAKQRALHDAARTDFVRAYSKIGKLDKANADIARALEIDPNSPEAMLERGILRQRSIAGAIGAIDGKDP